MYYTVKFSVFLKSVIILLFMLLHLLICPAASYGGDIISTGKDAAGIFLRDGCRIVSSPLRITTNQLPGTCGAIGLILLRK